VTITDAELDAMVEKFRERIGNTFSLVPINKTVTDDVIRRYALGVGDDNPLFVDPEYAAVSPWNGVIAPPSFLLTAVKTRSQGLPGMHGLFCGVDIVHERPVKAGEQLGAVNNLHSLEEKVGNYTGRSFLQSSMTRYHCGEETVAKAQSFVFRVRRDKAKESQKYRKLERKAFTDEEMRDIQQRYIDEVAQRRGADKFDLDAINVGDRIPPLLKGPLAVSDIICWLNGVGTGVFVRSSRQWYEYLSRHPKAGIKNDYGVWDSPEIVHWDERLAENIGMPGPYDYGWQRIAWLGHLVTDWIGDHAWVQRLKVDLKAPNYVGDLTTLTGTVTEVDHAAGAVTVDVAATDHRGRVTAQGFARVVAGRPEGWAR
jgi:acyl dehydratase